MVGAVAHEQHHLGEAVLLQQPQLMAEQRDATDIGQRLRHVAKHGAEPGALPAGENYRLPHGSPSWMAISRMARRMAPRELVCGRQPNACSRAVE